MLAGTFLREDCFCGAAEVVDYLLAHGEGERREGRVVWNWVSWGFFGFPAHWGVEGDEEDGRLGPCACCRDRRGLGLFGGF